MRFFRIISILSILYSSISISAIAAKDTKETITNIKVDSTTETKKNLGSNNVVHNAKTRQENNNTEYDKKELNSLFNQEKLSIQIEKINKLENYVDDYSKFTNALPPHVGQEITEYNKAIKLLQQQKKDYYNNLSSQAKEFLKNEKIAKKNIITLMQENQKENSVIIKNNKNEFGKVNLDNLDNALDNQAEKIMSEPERLKKLKNAISEYSKILASLSNDVKIELDKYRESLSSINMKNQELYKKLGKDSKEYLKQDRKHKKAIMQIIRK